ncbi:MAG: universal stress protein [Actinomycetota bacterium]
MQACRARTAAGDVIRNVLFATDFSEESAHAIQYVRSLQTGYHAKLFAVYVADVFPFSLSKEPSAVEKAGLIRIQAETRLRDFMLLHRFERKSFEPVVLSGEVFDAIDGFAASHDVDLIVLGSRGDLGLNRLFLGSAAEEIFRSAHCPVLTIGPQALAPHKDGRFHQLLFATDLSPHSRAAVPLLEQMLSQDSSTGLTVLHVLPKVAHPLEQHLRTPEIEAELRGLFARDLHGQIVRVIIEPGEPAQVIPQAAGAIGADLLVLGVRYGGAFLRATTHGVSSITNILVSKAPCPLLTIRSSRSAQES